MSKPQPTGRPGATARRPGAPQPAAPRQSEDLEALRSLPAFDNDGVAADIDPDNASSGAITNEVVTIKSAKFVYVDFRRKDGSYPENARPKVFLQVEYLREGDAADAKPYRQDYEYALGSLFVPSQDGNKCNVRKDKIAPGANPPTPRKTNPGVLFLKSIKDAGGKNLIERYSKEGIKVLNGITVHVRSQKVEGQNDNAKPVLLVDFIQGAEAPAAQAPKSVGAAAAPAQAAPAAEAGLSEVEQLAEQALLDILGGEESGSISRANVGAQLIRIDKWKSHAQRSAILKELREGRTVTRTDASWTFNADTNMISL